MGNKNNLEIYICSIEDLDYLNIYKVLKHLLFFRICYLVIIIHKREAAKGSEMLKL